MRHRDLPVEPHQQIEAEDRDRIGQHQAELVDEKVRKQQRDREQAERDAADHAGAHQLLG